MPKPRRERILAVEFGQAAQSAFPNRRGHQAKRARQSGGRFVPVDVDEWSARQRLVFSCALCGYSFTDRFDRGQARMEAHREKNQRCRARLARARLARKRS